MNRTIFMETKRIAFSKWEQGDLEIAELLWGDPAVTRLICASGRFSKEEIAARLQKEIENDAQYHVQYWPLFTRDTGELIGCCGLRPRTEVCFEIGIHLRPKFRRQGYAAEAMGQVMDYAFSALGAEKLFAGHNPNNAASAGLLRKLEFLPIGEEFYEPTGLYHPSYELKNPYCFAKK